MRGRRPDYYKEFHCIGGACTDTCCAGWEIDIDDVTYEKYQNLPEKLRKEICEEIGQEGETHFFRLKEGKRCPFLNGEGLCDIFLKAGEDCLCDICREHPRFYNWVGNYTEAGLGLCCEEAERLILGREEPVVLEEFGEDMGEAEDSLLEVLLTARESMIAILQDRNLPLGKRMYLTGRFAEKLQDILDFFPEEDWKEELNRLISFETEEKPDREEDTRSVQQTVLQELLEVYGGLEALDPAWSSYMMELKGRVPALLQAKEKFLQDYADKLYEYEQLAVYFIYRYFLESVFTMDVCTPVRFGAAGVLVIFLCGIDVWQKEGKLCFEKQCEIVRRYSKEVEYCTENVEAACAAWGETDILLQISHEMIE